jgi:GTPase SAR1 family protein
MNIIVEGLDRSGKSTLINRLLKEFPTLKHVHFTVNDYGKNQPKNDVVLNPNIPIYGQILSYTQCLKEEMESPTSGFIFDRWVYTDRAIGKLLHGDKTQYTTLDQQVDLDTYLQKCKTIVIWCSLLDTEYHRKLLKEEGINDILLDNYDTAAFRYTKVMFDASATLPLIMYDWKDGKLKLDDVIDLLVKYNKESVC